MVNHSGNLWLRDRLVLRSIYFLSFNSDIYCTYATGVRTIFNGYLHGLPHGVDVGSYFYSKYCLYRISDMGYGKFVIVFGKFFEFIRVDDSCSYCDRLYSVFDRVFNRCYQGSLY